MNSSYLKSAFGPSVIDLLLEKQQHFPNGPANLTQLTDLRIISEHDNCFSDVVNAMEKLYSAIKEYKKSIPSNYKAMVVALELVPTLNDIMKKVSEGNSVKDVANYYIERLKN